MMDPLQQWSPYISLATFVFLMLVGSHVEMKPLVLFAAGAAIPTGLRCLQLEAEARRVRDR